MSYNRKEDGTSEWKFYIKQYKKARYRKKAEREIRWLDKNVPGWHGIIIW